MFSQHLFAKRFGPEASAGGPKAIQTEILGQSNDAGAMLLYWGVQAGLVIGGLATY